MSNQTLSQEAQDHLLDAMMNMSDSAGSMGLEGKTFDQLFKDMRGRTPTKWQACEWAREVQDASPGYRADRLVDLMVETPGIVRDFTSNAVFEAVRGDKDAYKVVMREIARLKGFDRDEFAS